MGLSKQDLWKKQQEEEDKRNFFASEEVKAAVRRRAKVREVRAHERFEAMMGEVMRGMEEGIVAETDDVVFKRERALAKKHKEIHDEWEENVYRSIQSQIKSQVDAVDAEALSARLLAQSEKYTKTVRAKQASNAKAGVYLDCVVGYDYDPFEDAGHGNVTYRTSPFKDPTKRDVHKPIVEAIEAGRVKRSAALAELRAGVKPKETLGTEFWNNLAYTPHGRYTDADGELLPPRRTSRASSSRARPSGTGTARRTSATTTSIQSGTSTRSASTSRRRGAARGARRFRIPARTGTFAGPGACATSSTSTPRPSRTTATGARCSRAG